MALKFDGIFMRSILFSHKDMSCASSFELSLLKWFKRGGGCGGGGGQQVFMKLTDIDATFSLQKYIMLLCS